MGKANHDEQSEIPAAGDQITGGSKIVIGGGVGSGAIVAGRDVTVIFQGVEVRIPSLESVRQHQAALRCKLEAEAQARWGGMGAYIREEGARLPIEV